MREVSRLMQCTKIKLVLFKTTSISQHINFHAIFKHSKSGIPVSFMDLSIIFHEMDLWLTQAPTILVFHVTWQGKGSMRYGGLMPGRVPACQTEVTWGREWVRVMASQRRGQLRSKAEWVVGFWEMDGQPFYSRKDHHPLFLQAYTKQEFIFK